MNWIQIGKYEPFGDPYKPGALLECVNMVPSALKGSYDSFGGPSAVVSNLLAAACTGAFAGNKLDGSVRFFAGTSTKLYELTSSTTWTDRSRAGDYSIGSTDRWSACQFGDSTVAATPTAVLQRSTTGAFANIAGSPQAKIVESAAGFVVAFNTSVSSDTWYCSANLDETDWALSVATQCVTGRLVSTPGPITAAKRFGNDIVAYKRNAIYVGRYVGAPEVWQWTQVSAQVGCVGQHAVAEVPGGHMFMGPDNIYLFDGTTPRPVGDDIRSDGITGAPESLAYLSHVIYSKQSSLALVFWSPSSSTAATKGRAFSTVSGKWGVCDRTAEAVIDDEAGFGTSGLMFDAAHQLMSIAGSTDTTSSFTTGWYGDGSQSWLCRGIKFRFAGGASPTVTSTLTPYYQSLAVAGSATTGTPVTDQSDDRYNVRQTARWHQFKLSASRAMSVEAIAPDMVPAGRR